MQNIEVAISLRGRVARDGSENREMDNTMDGDGTLLQPYMRPFPEPETVFAGDVARHKRHFLPLMSLDASAIEPSWNGSLHIVSVKETCDGAVGEHCPEFHNDFCGDNKVAFSVDSDGKYTFLADFRFFLVERGHASQGFVDEFAKHYERTQASFEETKAFYRKTGFLNPNSARQPNRKDSWLRAGELDYADEHSPYLPNGRTFRFVAMATGWSYYDEGPGSVLLYFDPVDRIAVMRFAFT